MNIVNYIRPFLPLAAVILFLTIPLNSAFAQSGTIYDDFSDSNFTQNPVWDGQTADFEIYADSGNNELHLNATSSGSSYLSLQSTAAYGSWEFFIRLDFAPSNSNKAIVFLTSDRSDGDAMASGYALVLGESGSGDVVRLTRYDNGSRSSAILSGSTNIASGGSYQIKVTRNPDGIWELFVGDGYNSVPKLEASGTDKTYGTSSYFVLNPHYTSTRADKFYFDDIRIKALPIAPVSIQPVSNSQLNVLFSQDVDPSSLLISDFMVSDGIGSPDKASLEDNRTVSIFYSSPLNSGTYQLKIGNIKSTGGNSMQADTSLTFSLFDRPVYNDIVINEFMYDPPDNAPEYVELYNRSDKTFNLENWRLEDRTAALRVLASDSLILHPEDYLVATSDSSEMTSVFGKHRYIEMPSFPTLNNSGDAIELKDDQGVAIDSISYAGAKGTPGKSLERRSPNVSSSYDENWSPSLSSSGGTPGSPNMVRSDDLVPRMNYLAVVDSQTIKLGFSASLDSLSASAIADYSFTPAITPSSITIGAPDSVQISFNKALQADTLYTVSLDNVTDLFGNKVIPPDTTFTYYDIEPPDSGDVLITEFMARPPDEFSEYIELYNQGSKTVDLDSWMICDNTGKKKSIVYKSELLLPRHYVVLCPDSALTNLFPGIDAIVMGSRFPSLNNDGDAIALYDNRNRLLDSLSYDASWGTDEVALERRDFHVKAIYPENWGPSPSTAGGTPGTHNLIKKDKTAPVFEKVSMIKPNLLRLYFSKRVTINNLQINTHFKLKPTITIKHLERRRDQIDLSLKKSLKGYTNYTITTSGITDIFGNRSSLKSFKLIYKPDITPPVLISAQYKMNPSLVRLHFTEPVKIDDKVHIYIDGFPVIGAALFPGDSTVVNIRPAGLPDSKKDDHIKLVNITDESGNRLRDTTAIISRPPSDGQLVINEILYNPIQNKSDGLQDQSEFIECFNRSPFTLYLKDITIHEPPDEHNNLSYLIPLSDEKSVVLPHHYIVIHADTAVPFRHTRIARYFNPHVDSTAFLRVNRLTLGLSSSQSTIYLSNDHKNIDSLTYSDSWQNPNLPDTRGISLERIDVDSPGNSPDNWGSSASPDGGTPGVRNSIAASTIGNITKEGIILSPNPFSPDHDGFDDHLLIRYHLKNPDYLLHIRIFDRFGRLIRTLADGKRAGTNGTIIWDGLSQDHHPNRIGIYIILFEAYDPAGGNKKVYKKTVVLARKL